MSVRRFADGLIPLVERTEAEGGRAVAMRCDARDEDAMPALFGRVEADIGPIEVAVFNFGANVSSPLLDEAARKYRKIWEPTALAGFPTGREAARLRGLAGGKHALRALA